MRPGEILLVAVTLPNQPSIFMAAALVRWVRGQEYGVETLAVEQKTHSWLEHLINRLGACPTLGSTKISAHVFGPGSTISTQPR